MSVIEKDRGLLNWNQLKLDHGLTKGESFQCTEPHVPWTSVGSQSRLEAQGKYFKAMAKFARLLERDSKDHSVANFCNGHACSAKFSCSSLPISASLTPCYLSPSADLERVIWDVPANVSAALRRRKRDHTAKEITLGLSSNAGKVVPHCTSSTTAVTNDKPNRATVAAPKCRPLKSVSVLTSGISKSFNVSQCYVDALNVSSTSPKGCLLSCFPASENLLPVKWAHVLYTPATPPVASTLPTLPTSVLTSIQKPSDAKNIPRCKVGVHKVCTENPRREFQKGENNSSVFLPPTQEPRDYCLALQEIELPCVFRPACLENPHASTIMFSDRQVACSYMHSTSASPGRSVSARQTLKEVRNSTSDKLPGVAGSEHKKDAPVAGRTSSGSANRKSRNEKPKLPNKALPVSGEKPGRLTAKHQQRRSGLSRRFKGNLKDKKCSRKRNDPVFLPLISEKTAFGQFANTNNAALAFSPHSSPRAAKNFAAARLEVITLKSVCNITKSTNKSTKEKLQRGCPKSRESCLKTEERNRDSLIKPNLGNHTFDNCENDPVPKQCSLPKGINTPASKEQSLTKLPGLTLCKSVGKSRPKSKHRNGQRTALCDARKAGAASVQPRRLQKPLGVEEKPTPARPVKRFMCAKPRLGAVGIGNTKRVSQPETMPSACNSVASVITEEEEAMLTAKWAELKFLNLPSPRKPKDDPPRNNKPPNDLKINGKKTGRADSRNRGEKKKSGKKGRRKKEVQKKKPKNI